jgi:prophage antirepressor-like protein
MTTFFLEIFNELLKSDKVSIIIDENEYVWFSLSDLIQFLGLNPSTIKRNLAINYRDLKEVSEINVQSKKGNDLKPDTIMINEGGMYSIVLKSDGPLAKRLQEKTLSEIIPQLFETGAYTSNNEERKQIRKLNKNISKLRHLNKSSNNASKRRRSKTKSKSKSKNRTKAKRTYKRRRKIGKSIVKKQSHIKTKI